MTGPKEWAALEERRRSVLEVKLAHAEEELRHAEHTRQLLTVSLDVETELDVPPWWSDRLRVELHAADLRLDLWRQVIADLRKQLGR